MPEIRYSIEDSHYEDGKEVIISKYCYICYTEALDKILGIKNYK